MNNKLKRFPKHSSLNDIRFTEQERKEVIQRLQHKKQKRIWFKPALGFITLAAMFIFVIQFGWSAMTNPPAQPPETQSPSEPLGPDGNDNVGIADNDDGVHQETDNNNTENDSVDEDDQNHDKMDNNSEEPTDDNTAEQNPDTGEEKEISQPSVKQLKQLHNTFTDELIQDTGQNGKVLNYDSKQALVNHLSQYATREIARKEVDRFYHERQGALYLEGSGGPYKIRFNENVDRKQISETKYQISQTRNTEMLEGNVIFVFEHQNGNWIITKYTFKPNR